MLVFFATLANADGWVEMEVFGKEHEKFLRNYLELSNGIPSHDTIQRVFAMVLPEFLENFQKQWDEMLNSDEGSKIKRLLAIDGKTQRGNGSKNQKANHIVSAVDGKGFCLGQKRVEENPSETGDYVLVLKANQGNLLEDVSLYFSEGEHLKKCAYKKTIEKARGKIENSHVSYLDGSKVYFKNGGWVIARFSGTEPLLRIFCELPDAARAAEICGIYEEFLGI